MNCPGFENLVDYVDGRLAFAAAAAVDNHLATCCGRCEEDRLWYERVRIVAAGDKSIEPPLWVLRRAVRIFENQPAQIAGIRRAGRVLASLVFDSVRTPSLAMVRSMRSEDRQLMYQAGDYSIDLQIASRGRSHANVTGQILCRGDLSFESVNGLALAIVREGGVVISTATNERGEFQVRELSGGTYDLRIDADELSITIVGLPVA